MTWYRLTNRPEERLSGSTFRCLRGLLHPAPGSDFQVNASKTVMKEQELKPRLKCAIQKYMYSETKKTKKKKKKSRNVFLLLRLKISYVKVKPDK